MSFLLHYYCHSFRITVIPSGLLSFLPNIVILSELLPFRDGNSSENFTPQEIGESKNGDLTFLGDRGRSNLFLGVLGEFRGMSYHKNH